jgi:seryl-tRNA synthetase
MHDIRLIRENPDAFDQGLRNRGMEPLSSELIRLDDARRAAISEAQAAQEKRNALSKEVGAAKKAKDEARAAELMAEVARLKETAPELEKAEAAATKALNDRLAEIPNIPGPDVPVGPDESGNEQREEHRFEGNRQLGSGKQHFELAEAWKVGIGPAMDFEAAAKLSGSRFVVLRGQLARLERALGQFMLDLHTTEHGYTEVSPPLLVWDETMFGTAQLPKFRPDQFLARAPAERSFSIVGLSTGYPEWQTELKSLEDLYLAGGAHLELYARVEKLRGKLKPDDFDLLADAYLSKNLWLIPTAEVPLTNLVRESILSDEELPLRFTALTPCFRAEAGAAGRDTRGMLRQHQFTKCELVSITTPETSPEEHERMLACAETVLQRLDLPFRVMTLCTGDMGFASAKTYDIEVWMPGQGTYREISSCSVCTDFQARRMNARFRAKGEKAPRFVHTLNGSGVAVGRALIAVLENYQEPDGSVTIPSALQSYMGGLTRIGG